MLSAGISGTVPGLVGRMNGSPIKVVYMLSCSIKLIRPCCSPPRLECAEAEFFNFVCISVIFAYVGNTGCVSIDKYGKPSRTVATIMDMMVIVR